MVLPPEKAEGCESYLQYLSADHGEREAARDAGKSSGKKRISLNVSREVSQRRSAEHVLDVLRFLCNLSVVLLRWSRFFKPSFYPLYIVNLEDQVTLEQL